MATNNKTSQETHLLLTSVRDVFSGRPEFEEILHRLASPSTETYGLHAVGSAKGLLLASLVQKRRQPLVVVTPDQSSAYLLADDLTFFLTGVKNAPAVYVFPHLEILPYESHAPELTIRMERLAPIQAWIEQRHEQSAFIVVTPIHAILKRLPSIAAYKQKSLHLKKGQEIRRESVAEWLVAQGYEFRDLVAQRGDFSTRGDIIDIYSYSYPDPVRIELWGDEVESIRLFQVSTQRSSETLDEAVFYPGNEDEVLRQALEAGEALCSLPDLFGAETPVAVSGFEETEQHGLEFEALVDKRFTEYQQRPEDEAEVDLGQEDFHKHQAVLLEPPQTLYYKYEEWRNTLHARQRLFLMDFALEPGPDVVDLGCATVELFGEDAKERIATLLRECEAGRRVVIVCDNTGQQSRLNEILHARREELAIPATAKIPQTLVGSMHRGFTIETRNLMVCTDREIFGRYRRFRTPPRDGIAVPLSDLLELKPGDHVVHIDHGIGRFVKLTKIEHEGKQGEYLVLEYAEGGMLYVPIEQIDRIGRYVGGENAMPALSKLGTKNWERTKARAKQAIEDMAEELLDLYATRSTAKGYAFNKDNTWQHEFEASFMYEETADQYRAIEEVKRDMESDEPMDRLICGDVGFGKTEIAIRACFKAVMDGKQVAVLVPTTILCQQHFTNLSERMADYPVRVEMLSRFQTAGEQKDIVEAIANGDVDIAVGTHRMLSRDVRFADLGLVIIDEEQRFGVKHKERLRQLKKLVDTLTLTATPIPRTLYMSISGIRNMSLVSTPPKNRLPIETYIMEWSEEVIENAVLRELSRDGQVYFVHNRVETIYQMAHRLQELVPQARLCVAHGQMSEHELEKIMLAFIRHEYDMLVATTIIENGIDIPNVNTIIINKADTFGLSQLYQLRGRVGRDRHRAYCYLLVPSKTGLTSLARRRLLALQEHNQLGSGFHLAMRDMELRGIGNILGREQHGYIAAIGFDLYTKLLSDTILMQKNRKGIPIEWETVLEMSPKGTIPPTYIESSKQRMALHQRIVKIKTPEAIDELKAELEDIYGKIPPETERLMQGLRLRVRAYQAGMDTVNLHKHNGYIRYHASQQDRFHPMRVLQLDGKNGLKLQVAAKGDHVAIEFQDKEKKGDLMARLLVLLDELDQPLDTHLPVPAPSAPPTPAKPGKKIKSDTLRNRLKA
ncbi:MAG: transcription-repair coupling factor [bacterium]|jgi:transcription-repair coupling factor (superfamily II helicase)|nr:transcription-repair coupling factor [bacterium]